MVLSTRKETLHFAEYNLTISAQLENLDDKKQWTLSIKHLGRLYKTNTSSNVMEELKKSMLPENVNSDTTDTTANRFIKNLAAKKNKKPYEQKILDLLLQHKDKAPINTTPEHPPLTTSKKITPKHLSFKLSKNRQELLLTKNPVEKQEDLILLPKISEPKKTLDEITAPPIITPTKQGMFKPSPCYRIVLEDKIFWFEKSLNNDNSIYFAFNTTREKAYQLFKDNKQHIIHLLVDSIKTALFTRDFISSIKDNSTLKELFIQWQDECDSNNTKADLTKQTILAYANNDAIYTHYLENEITLEKKSVSLPIVFALAEINSYEIYVLKSSHNETKQIDHKIPSAEKKGEIYILYDSKTEHCFPLSLEKTLDKNSSSTAEKNQISALNFQKK